MSNYLDGHTYDDSLMMIIQFLRDIMLTMVMIVMTKYGDVDSDDDNGDDVNGDDDNSDDDNGDDDDDDDDDDDYGLQEDEVSPVPSLSVEPLAGGVLPCNANILTPILCSV